MVQNWGKGYTYAPQLALYFPQNRAEYPPEMAFQQGKIGPRGGGCEGEKTGIATENKVPGTCSTSRRVGGSGSYPLFNVDLRISIPSHPGIRYLALAEQPTFTLAPTNLPAWTRLHHHRQPRSSPESESPCHLQPSFVLLVLESIPSFFSACSSPVASPVLSRLSAR